MKIKAVCFDMDGTLIRNTNSVRYLCMLNNKLEELEKIEYLEESQSISWIEADHLKAELITGLDLKDVEEKFKGNVVLIQNIEQVLTYLREKGIKSVLITAGPVQVVNILVVKFGFNDVYGSLYEVIDQKFTGRITTHLNNNTKLDCLNDFCVKNNISPDQCVAVGDSESDIDIFKKCGKSIAINFTDALKGKASEYIITDDLSDIIDVIELWLYG
jgi:phosphoserine phosphatase